MPVPKQNRKIIHVDMDAFYASIEQRDNPEFKGKPVIVGAAPKGGRGRGVVSAASYEARKFGIHSAMPISRAFRLCPNGIFLPVRGSRYVSVSQHIMAIFREYTPLIEPISLDEAFLDLAGTERLLGDAESVALRIQKKIWDEVQLTASVGVAPNKLLAKMASEVNKPNGHYFLCSEKIKDFLDPLPVKALWGVGKQTQKALKKFGIHTIGDIASHSQAVLKDHFGKAGEMMWKHANGMDDRPVIAEREVKSVSNEHTFNQNTTDEREIREILLFLSEKVAHRLRKQKLLAKTIIFKVRYEDFTTRIHHTTLNKPTRLGKTIFSEVIAHVEMIMGSNHSIRLLGVGAAQLISAVEEQTSLFDDNENKHNRVSDAMDTILQKYGTGSIQRGMIQTPDRTMRQNPLDKEIV